ncbi:serine-type D-Ala-D-Ala carboxypeptidase [Candidatus Palibaumannia cicadellinicola]|uniref:D-alanyl-D-alanine carboxypeptidase/D-alanyl-D-alanine-endopeptidase n=1 Tax=Baumannia cicadellinicola subsp. Homalodisca coagulata TaxID=374463 RepID=Q1LSK0_BAUCH|nr:serine-type D-Ala-D-Ala carboxypeptidase [Candidatus Baumannia cicadellinicola]ABF14301.1 D-alanyl-D-alanine carboxypeptidase/D-alanyl-D-alanine-endopeptidase [Baumannia cicadellinicola str. Hc (Homalodisca coagulata)]MCJ7461978.1 serine-type D-Ala-D-Ala carboxypeptidase [Candidatus Baumannia cicadellinicola]MCJ7462540.1 serine-type D-Ala-D-Ala carboxypeptidase [Candidatus Baumannia cicadellinicola]
MRFTKIIICLISVVTFSAQATTIKKYISFLPKGTNLALMVQKVGAQYPIIDYHSQQLSQPASTIKLLTALAALLQLGPTYRFQTFFETAVLPTTGILHGDLIARFGGDPTMTSKRLRVMVAKLRKEGIKQITGNLIIDTSIFINDDRAPGWRWSDLTKCFSTPPGAAIIDHNCFSILLYSGKTIGDKANIKISSYYPVHIFSQVRTLASRSKEYCKLNIIPDKLNSFKLTGCMTYRNKPLPLTFAVQDGAYYVGSILQKEFKQANIVFNGTILHKNILKKQSHVLVQSSSAPLHNLLHIMLKKSDNLIADTVFRIIGHEFFQAPSNWSTSSDAVRKIIQQQTGINLGNTIQVDGSGLSRHNLISPAIMMRILQYIGEHDKQLNFISMLPLAGYDGTLTYRTSLHKAGVYGKLSAKTGSLQNVYNLAGFLTTSRGQRLAFVQYLSGYTTSTKNISARKIPLICFEHQLYKDLYQQN